MTIRVLCHYTHHHSDYNRWINASRLTKNIDTYQSKHEAINVNERVTSGNHELTHWLACISLALHIGLYCFPGTASPFPLSLSHATHLHCTLPICFCGSRASYTLSPQQRSLTLSISWAIDSFPLHPYVFVSALLSLRRLFSRCVSYKVVLCHRLSFARLSNDFLTLPIFLASTVFTLLFLFLQYYERYISLRPLLPHPALLQKRKVLHPYIS